MCPGELIVLYTRLHEYYIAEWVGKNKVAYLAGVTLVPGDGGVGLRWRTVQEMITKVFAVVTVMRRIRICSEDQRMRRVRVWSVI